MATAKKTQTTPVAPTPPANIDVPAQWADATVLDGVDLIDKTALVGTPFLITGAKFTVNARDITMVWVEGELSNGDTFTFNDSSTGVLAEMSEYVKRVNNGETPALDAWTDLRVICPRGLRVSHYTVKDERNKDRAASTYYLTKSGRRS